MVNFIPENIETDCPDRQEMRKYVEKDLAEALTIFTNGRILYRQLAIIFKSILDFPEYDIATNNHRLAAHFQSFIFGLDPLINLILDTHYIDAMAIMKSRNEQSVKIEAICNGANIPGSTNVTSKKFNVAGVPHTSNGIPPLKNGHKIMNTVAHWNEKPIDDSNIDMFITTQFNNLNPEFFKLIYNPALTKSLTDNLLLLMHRNLLYFLFFVEFKLGSEIQNPWLSNCHKWNSDVYQYMENHHGTQN